METLQVKIAAVVNEIRDETEDGEAEQKSPDSVLEFEVDELITKDMLEEEKRLHTEREEEDKALEREALEEAGGKTGLENDSFSKLDFLLEQTKAYTNMLLENMDSMLPKTTASLSGEAETSIKEATKINRLSAREQRALKRKKNLVELKEEETETPAQTIGRKGRRGPKTRSHGKKENEEKEESRREKKGKKSLSDEVERLSHLSTNGREGEGVVAGKEKGGESGEGKGETGGEDEEDEERLLKEQMELIPNLTGGRLKSYQIKGVRWLISLWQNGLNGILADQMGLGKTVQTIAFLSHLKSNGMHGPFLIVAPLSTLSNWIREIRKWMSSSTALLYHGSKDERRFLLPLPSSPVDANFPIIVTSFEVAMMDRARLWKFHWKYLVVDEGHRLKNFDCKLIRELRRLTVENTLLLTGTPLQNNLIELWSLLNFLLPSVFSSQSEFASWFDIAGKRAAVEEGGERKRDEVERSRHCMVVSKLHQILRPFLLRRLKEDVEKSLPKKKEIILYCPYTERQNEFEAHLIKKTLASFVKETTDNPAVYFSRSQISNLYMQLRKNCNHPDLVSSHFDSSSFYPPVEVLLSQCGKLQLLERLVRKLRERGHKILVFSQMTRMLDILDYFFSELGLDPCRIDGSVNQKARAEQIESFNTNPSLFVFLLSTRAGGLGINLTAADTVIIYDSDWNPHMDMQAMDRCHRIGQTRPVHVYRLVTSNSVECRMLRVANEKLKLDKLVIEKGEFVPEKVKGADLLVQKGGPSGARLDETEILALLRPDSEEYDARVQGHVISDENLDKLLDRSDLVVSSSSSSSRSLIATKSTGKGYVEPFCFPLRGPGWEVVVANSTRNKVLSGIGN